MTAQRRHQVTDISRALTAAGLAANLYRRTATANDARRLARRFRIFEDLILRFATHPDLDIFSNNEAERTIRPVKVQQRSSGGSWRTLEGLAEFALVHSYLSTAAKWGILVNSYSRRAGKPESWRAGKRESWKAGKPESGRAGKPESRRAG